MYENIRNGKTDVLVLFKAYRANGPFVFIIQNHRPSPDHQLCAKG